MLTKLTLSIEKELIQKAKYVAKKRKTSISQIVEEHLKRIIAEEQAELASISPITKSLFGIASDLSTSESYKDLVAESRTSKYLSIK